MANNDLPEYKTPPVSEVVCGILFKNLEALRVPYFGLFWQQCRDEFPTCQEVAPLMPIIEQFGTDRESAIQLNDLPLPRVWLINQADTAILQIQRDRFLHNWKKAKPTDKYVRYPTVIGMFRRHLEAFETFLSEYNLGKIEPLQYEITYVNHIPVGEGWSEVSDLGKIFRDHQWNGKENRFLPGIEHLNLGKTFALPSGRDRLHVSIRDGRRKEDAKPTLLFELTVRGFPGDGSRDALWEWFGVGREWIVRGFTDLTTESVQKNIWGRTR